MHLCQDRHSLTRVEGSEYAPGEALGGLFTLLSSTTSSAGVLRLRSRSPRVAALGSEPTGSSSEHARNNGRRFSFHHCLAQSRKRIEAPLSIVSCSEAVPRKVFFGEVPRNPTGKIEKPKLRKRYGGMEEAFKL